MITISDIILFVNSDEYYLRDKKNSKITGFKPITSATNGEISFYSYSDNQAVKKISSSNASTIICDKKLTKILNLNKNLIFVDNPRLWFFRCVNKFSKIDKPKGIHPTAIIESKITGKNIFVGPYTVIGKNVTIGDNTVIFGNVHIYANTMIGKNVTINAGTVIGARGFGYEVNENNDVETFHHLGGVEIHNDVEIGANVCIDRGTLENTIIEDKTIIDNLVHVGHNVKIGKNCQIVALSLIGGSTIIEENVKVSMCSVLRDNILIGRKSIIGMGSVVTKDVKNDTVVFGNPARVK